MSTPTSKVRRRAAWTLPATLALAACADMAPPVTRLAVAGGAVTVAGPTGYCIDRRSRRAEVQGTFLLLSQCPDAAAPAGGLALPDPDVAPVILTALVSQPMAPGAAPSPAEMERMVRSAPGRAGLARDGDPASVRILDSRRQNDVVYLRMTDRSDRDSSGAALSQDIWRAMYWSGDRLTVLSVKTLAARPVSSDEAERVLRRFVAATRAATAAGRTPA